MSLSKKFRHWNLPKHRIEAFSDAVFAIVMTLLVLELKLPKLKDPSDVHEIWAALREVAPMFFSWLVSFFFVAMIWLHHHHIMYMTTRSDYAIIWINNILLFFICLLPFPTAMMGEYPHSPLILSFWGVTVAVTCFVLWWFYHYNTKHYLRETYDPKSVKKNVRLSLFAGPVLYLIAAGMAWVSVYITYVLYLLVPLCYILPLDKEREVEG